MRIRVKLSETDIAKAVIDNLVEQGWEIYQEVADGPGICDIVAKQGKILWAIECKLSFNFTVIEQIYKWRCRANYLSVAVGARVSEIAHAICKSQGIGILRIEYNEMREMLHPHLFRKITPFKLNEIQKTFCDAGSRAGAHWTPFKQTVRDLVHDVKQNPGIEYGELIKGLHHHYANYASARSCLKNWIGTSVIPGLEFRTIDNKLCVFPKEGV